MHKPEHDCIMKPSECFTFGDLHISLVAVFFFFFKFSFGIIICSCHGLCVDFVSFLLLLLFELFLFVLDHMHFWAFVIGWIAFFNRQFNCLFPSKAIASIQIENTLNFEIVIGKVLWQRPSGSCYLQFKQDMCKHATLIKWHCHFFSRPFFWCCCCCIFHR